MTGKTDFSDDEWAHLKRGPFVAGMAISLADPGGPIELVKETAATLRTVRDAATSGGHGELVEAIAKEVVSERENPVRDFKPHGAMATQEIVDEITAADRIATEKATPEEAAAYRDWMRAAAHEAANAAKEGGFLGFRAERVSEGEQRMLDKLDEVLGKPA